MASPFLLPAIATGIGGVLSFLGGSAQARAQQRMAQAQERAAQAAIEERRRERQMALQFAEPSEAELNARQSFLDLQTQVLGRTQRELSFLQRGLDLTSPGASEAGQGLFSSILARGRATQRAALESTLRRRLGAGYATSSAGQAALQQFDQGTMDLSTQAIPQFLQQAYQSVQMPMAVDQSIKARQIGAAQATAVSPMMMQAAPMAGASNVGAIQMGSALGQLGGSFSNIGGQFLGQQMQLENMKSFADIMKPSLNQMALNQYQQSPMEVGRMRS